jgi:undecaprenyl-diphosphatase
MAVYGIVAWLVTREAQQRGPEAPQRGAVLRVRVAVGLLILAIGFSRIFLSVHYLTDVVGGFLVGLFWVMAARALADRDAGR